MNMNILVEDFIKVFGGSQEGVHRFLSPGRVNLIGDHVDYNGGFVFPCALSFGTYAIARKREDATIRLFSNNFKDLGIIVADVFNINYEESHDWANYPKGLVKVLQDAGYKIDTGFDVLFYGNIPNGAGLSSSASIELATAIVLKTLFNLEIEMLDMVKFSQKSENEFNGVNCGIMDQFAIGMGKKDHAILLDTNTLNYQYTPIKLQDVTIVIANTNKRRGLAESKYNERRGECETALTLLQQKIDITALGMLTEEVFEENKHLIEDEVVRKRAKHAVYENQRTIKAVKALNAGDLHCFGQLMNDSHISLRDDYEVSCNELDTLVSAAWKNGSIGSRMTGAGFGGCTVNLVKTEDVETFIQNVGNEYQSAIGYSADFYIASIGDGTREI